MSGEVSNNAAPGSGSSTVKDNNASTVLGNFVAFQSVTAVVDNSLDTQTDIDNFFVNVKEQNHAGKIDAVSSPVTEGSGSLRVNVPEEDFYGTEQFHYLDQRPEYPSDGLERCHIRFWVYLDANFDIDNPYAGEQMGKAFPGFDGRWGDGASENENPWEAIGGLWSADAIGGSANDWVLGYYIYDKNTPLNDTGRTEFPNTSMQKDQWYQIDRFVDVPNNVIRQWQDGNLVIDLDSSDIDLPSVDPYDKVYAIRNLVYYGGGWAAPSGSGNNHLYLDNIRVYDEENPP
jgi:hypothetical protein